MGAPSLREDPCIVRMPHGPSDQQSAHGPRERVVTEISELYWRSRERAETVRSSRGVWSHTADLPGQGASVFSATTRRAWMQMCSTLLGLDLGSSSCQPASAEGRPKAYA